ncbi:SMP-30/gluconolactonase/LRE family protein [Halomicrococcus sp. NG-SE-24]|uniref:SMP-30/gluconolactonase/LRE family protein n=1 Tax=Halomicrococcus sp. NG-SE-24 TaxID=3436928 RepID=UPI003D95400E
MAPPEIADCLFNLDDAIVIGADPWLDRCLDHPEDVAVDETGVIYAGGEAGQLYRIDRTSETFTELAATEGFVLGVEIGPDGDLYACDFQQHAVFRLPLGDDRPAGSLEAVVRGGPDQRPLHPNYCAFDEAGRLFVSDSGYRRKLPGPFDDSDGCLYAVNPDGTERVLTTEPAAFPNGLAISKDGSTLYVCETGTRVVTAIHLDDGEVTDSEVITDECGMVDGLALDVNDRLYVASIGDNAIYRVADDEVEPLIADPEGQLINNPTNVAFGGPDMRTLYIANLGLAHITAIEIDATGRHPTGRA